MEFRREKKGIRSRLKAESRAGWSFPSRRGDAGGVCVAFAAGAGGADGLSDVFRTEYITRTTGGHFSFSEMDESMDINGLMPIPPAMKTTRFSPFTCSFERVDGGQMKLPPTLTCISLLTISENGRKKNAAGGLEGDLWMQSSRYGRGVKGARSAVDGGDVIVKPPTCDIEGMWTSSH